MILAIANFLGVFLFIAELLTNIFYHCLVFEYEKNGLLDILFIFGCWIGGVAMVTPIALVFVAINYHGHSNATQGFSFLASMHS